MSTLDAQVNILFILE